MLTWIKKIKAPLFIAISCCIPKNKKIWLFGAWQGKLYADNTRCLFEYLYAQNSKCRKIWIAKENDVVRKVREAGYEAYHYRSLKGIWYTIIGSLAFCTESHNDVSDLLNKKTKVIQLWHGMGIKSVGLESGWNNGQTKEELKYWEDSYKRQHATWYWMVASEEAKQKYMRSFSVPEQQFTITGQPKDDTFINVPQCQMIDEIRKAHPGCKIAVYLPTHRKFGTGVVNPMLSAEALLKVDEQLRKINAVLIFKPHFHEFKLYEKMKGDLTNIILALDKEKYGDVYEFLPACDMLITDYSGIMFGYLASGKPIIYFTYDYDTYVSDDAGFCYDFDDITYGPICKTWDEVIENIDTLSADDYSNKREKQRARFCPFNDGKNCERIYEQACKLIDL